LIDIDAFHLGVVSHSWSRQRFSLSLITWTSLCQFILIRCWSRWSCM
jgi:hypothetical protein